MLDKEKWVSVGKGALIAAVGAALAYLSQWATSADLGQFGPLLAAILAVLVNAFRKAFTN